MSTTKKNENDKLRAQVASLRGQVKAFGAGKRPSPYIPPVSRFLYARVDPFSNDADGARLVDEYCFPTATRRIEKRFTLRTDSTGEAGLVLLPNLSDVSAFTKGNAASMGGSLDGATTLYYDQAVTMATLDSVLATHRIVGWGAKVTWIQNVTQIKGNYTLAGIPCAAHGDFSQALAGVATTVDKAEDVFKTLGVPYTGTTTTARVDVSSLAALPYATTALPLAKGEDVYMVSKPTSAHATFFRQSNVRRPGADAWDSSTAAAQAQDMSVYSKHGWEAFVLGVRGAVPSDAVAEVTMVFHLEGTPVTNNGNVRDASLARGQYNPQESDMVARASTMVPSTMVATPFQRQMAISSAVARAMGAARTPVGSTVLGAAAGLVTYGVTRNPAKAGATFSATRDFFGSDPRAYSTPTGLLIE